MRSTRGEPQQEGDTDRKREVKGQGGEREKGYRADCQHTHTYRREQESGIVYRRTPAPGGESE